MKTDLNGYLVTLGKLALISRILNDAQEEQAKSGILEEDEEMNAQNITWAVDKLLDMIDAQVRLISGRTPKTWEETLKEISVSVKDTLEKKENL